MPKSETLEAFYASRYEPLALRSCRPNTKRLYRHTLVAFARFLRRPPLLADLTDATVSGFAASRLQDGLAKATVNNELFNLLAIWRWAHKKGRVRNWPDVELEKPPERVPVALTQAEIARVIQAIQDERRSVGDVAGPRFWLALFLLIWDTAERIGAVMDLTWDRVDLPGGWVKFRAEGRKGATRDILRKIAPDTATALAALRRRDGKVFVWPYNPTYIFDRFGQVMQRAGLPKSKLYKFHAIRKSTASHFEAAGGNATELLDHSSRKVTKSYLDPRIVRPDQAVDRLFRPGA